MNGAAVPREVLLALVIAERWQLPVRPPRRHRRARPVTCHPGRPMLARGLCRPCYLRDWRAGRLDDHPPVPPRRSLASFAREYETLASRGLTLAEVAASLHMKPDAVYQQRLRAHRAGLVHTPTRPTYADRTLPMERTHR